jgi:hypothetical protein
MAHAESSRAVSNSKLGKRERKKRSYQREHLTVFPGCGG